MAVGQSDENRWKRNDSFKVVYNVPTYFGTGKDVPMGVTQTVKPASSFPRIAGGRPAILFADSTVNSTTSLWHDYTSVTIDVGNIMLGAALVGAYKYIRTPYTVRVVAMFVGILKPYVVDRWGATVAWKVSHQSAPSDPYDSLTADLHVSVQAQSVGFKFWDERPQVEMSPSPFRDAGGEQQELVGPFSDYEFI